MTRFPRSTIDFQIVDLDSKNLSYHWVSRIVMDTQNAIKLVKHIFDSSYGKPSLSLITLLYLDLIDSRLNCKFNTQNLVDRPLSLVHFEKRDYPEYGKNKIRFMNLYEKEDCTDINNKIQLNLIEQAGRFLDLVTLQVFHDTRLDMLLNHIATHCNKASSLLICGLDSLVQSCPPTTNDEEELINTCSNITSISINDCIPTPEDFIKILKHLSSSLDLLTLINCFTKKFWCKKRYFSIHLPNLTLDYLVINMTEKFSDISKDEAYYIKLVTDGED